MHSLQEMKAKLTEYKPILRDKYHISDLGIFGSYVRGEQTQESDLDVLIDYDKPPDLFTLVEIEQNLSEMLDIKVDLITRKGIKPQLLFQVLEVILLIK